MKRIMPLIAHATVCTMLFHIEFMVAPNPSVAIFGPIKAAANTANNPTMIGIGFMFMTALRMPWAPAIANVELLAATIKPFMNCIGLTTAIMENPVANMITFKAIIVPLYAIVANCPALVTAVIAIIAIFCTVNPLANAIDAIRTPTKYPAKPINNTPNVLIATDGATNMPFKTVPTILI